MFATSCRLAVDAPWANAGMLRNWLSTVSYDSSILGLLQIRDISHLSNMLTLGSSAAWRRERALQLTKVYDQVFAVQWPIYFSFS
jgi:hypothetical protein